VQANWAGTSQLCSATASERPRSVSELQGRVFAVIAVSIRNRWLSFLGIVPETLLLAPNGAKPPFTRIVLNLSLVQTMLDEAALRTLHACIQISCAAATICTEVGLEDRSSLGWSMRARSREATGQPPAVSPSTLRKRSRCRNRLRFYLNWAHASLSKNFRTSWRRQSCY